MPHETALIVTIAAGVGLALLFGLLASRLRIPPLVGYLLAGVAIGPFTPGFVAHAGLAQQLAEIGVILLMFGVGIHFSPGDLLAVRKIALPGAAAQILFTTALGATVARLWGWPWGSGLVFGLCLSVASTVVLLRALEDRRALESLDGRIALGWLVVQDMATVLVLVLLPAFAAPLSGAALAADFSLVRAIAITLAKVLGFMVLMFVVARRAVPWLLEHVAGTGSRELFTLTVLAVALGIAVGAAAFFGVSFALGAFVAGMVVNGSSLSHEAAADALPFQDAFSVLFFVSVGMLFDPQLLLQQPLQILAVVLIVMIGQSFASFMIVLLLHYPLSTAVTVSASLAQIGEFSFILAGLGLSLGVLPPSAQGLIVMGAVISISLNPLAFAVAARLGHGITRWPRGLALIDRLHTRQPVLNIPATPSRMSDHVVIVGYGKVGSAIADILARNEVPYVAIEQDYERVQALRDKGIQIFSGDASRPGVLDQLNIARARLLVVTAPEPFKARAIIKVARQANPALDTVVRTHSDDEKAYLEQINVGRAVMGERELAHAMADYALDKFAPVTAPE